MRLQCKKPMENGQQVSAEFPSKQQYTPATQDDQTPTSQPADAPLEPQEKQQPQQQPTNQQPQQQQEIGLIKKYTIDGFLYLIKGLIATYDLISQPIFYFKHDVRRRRQQVDQLRSLKFDPSDPNSAWRQVDIEPRQVELERTIDSFETYDQLMASAFRRNSAHRCYGYRQVVDEKFVKRPESERLLRQLKLTDFRWVTYGQFEAQIEAARKGFLLEGIRAGDNVMLFADTRAEWQIVSQALIRLGAVVGTMYSTLGVDGIVHTMNETKVSHVVTQRDKVTRLLKLKSKLPLLKRIIYFECSLHLPEQLKGEPYEQDFEQEKDIQALRMTHIEEDQARFEHPDVKCKCFSDLLLEGLKLDHDSKRLDELEADNKTCRDRSLANQLKSIKRPKDSLAVIMYTSGSTGIPKGVLISHGNIMATIKSFSYVTKDFVHKPHENLCTAYLPLAHIFEFCIESVMLYHGVAYGFATPHTLTDKSPGLLPGQKGDLGVLRPTVMIIVPLILDRVVQGVKQTLATGPYFKGQLVSYLIDYKAYWQKRHYETPLVDKIVCSKIAAALGGRAKWIICGSAPLSGATQTFVRAALNLKLPQGFGTTETCAATACQLFDDQSTGNVGLPVAGAQIKLEPWLEGNYRPDDKPNPRGEIVVGGEMIAQGYFNLESQTEEAFYVDSAGVRWYRTGDIGEFLPNGQLKIIDRKKDLVKLQNGEYISLGRVESTLKSNPYTENFCVYANSNHNYVVALGPANEAAIKSLAQQLVDDSERRPSPSNSRRSASPDNEQHRLNELSPNSSGPNSRAPSGTHTPVDEERAQLLMSDEECQTALDELKQLLAKYEDDMNNNNIVNESQLDGLRKMSSASSTGAANEKGGNETLQKLCSNRLINDHVLGFLNKTARERNLMRLEIPKKLLLLSEEWTEDKNLVTAAMKIRRNFVYKRYEKELEQLYASSS